MTSKYVLNRFPAWPGGNNKNRTRVRGIIARNLQEIYSDYEICEMIFFIATAPPNARSCHLRKTIAHLNFMYEINLSDNCIFMTLNIRIIQLFTSKIS